MHKWVVQTIELPFSDPKPVSPKNVAAITKERCPHHWMEDVNNTPKMDPGDFKPVLKDYADKMDLVSIKQRPSLRSLILGKDRRFYSDMDTDSESDADEDGEPDIGDIATLEPTKMEAYGPTINVGDVATAVTTPLTDQQCMICLQDHVSSRGKGRTVKLLTCGHYFHHDCIGDWADGTKPNSNKCPECRVEFCARKRTVRPVV
jgi:hypothetical protein